MEEEFKFTCGICNKFPESPVIIPCGDLYCKECLTRVTTSDKNECPLCYRLYYTVPEVSKSFDEVLSFLKEHGNNALPPEDLLQCCICLDLLWKPSVSNCGHWLCFWCCVNIHDCPLCREHFTLFPSCFKQLHNFLKLKYPTQYEERGLGFEQKEKVFLRQEKFDMTRILPPQTALQILLFQPNPSVMTWHPFGCDGCGIFPIVGDKFYRCTDCLEVVGYDLCANCYEVKEKIVSGLYEQKHDPKTHQFMPIDKKFLTEVILQLPIHEIDGQYYADGNGSNEESGEDDDDSNEEDVYEY